ncbi:MAG: hypothetical protein IPO04_18275 [Cytophagaceae bacterium]|nr:hypothetical protein [Cytophagaceae bacterium]
MDTRIRIIAEAITKDAENNLKRLADLKENYKVKLQKQVMPKSRKLI